MKRLMIGAGIHKRDGWYTLDGSPANNPDFCVVLPGLPHAITDWLWDEFEWIHGITSLYPWDAARVLCELRPIIQPNGVLILEQPDLRKALEYAAKTGMVNWLFGDAYHQNPWIMNRWAYAPEALAEAVRRAGFSRVEVKPAVYHVPARDFRIEARP